MAWIYVGVAAVLGLAATWWLRRGSYRVEEDVRYRQVKPWWAPVVAVLAAIAAGPFFAPQQPLIVLTYLLALVWGIVLAMIDLEVRRLPDQLTLPAYPVAAVLLVGCSAVTQVWSALLVAAACAGGAVLVFGIAAVVGVGSEGLGLGDVKLAGVLGALLGWIGWISAVMGLLTGFIFGGVLAGVLLIFRRADRKSHMSFGPAMIMAAYVWALLTISA